MADSKNPPVLPEGYDPELDKANKGFAALEKERREAQMKLDAEDQKAKDRALGFMKFGADALKFVKEPAKSKAKGGKVSSYKAGGSVSSASKRADGCAIRGKTKGRML